ncbi:hypothetical protein BH20ACT8_BH20ACT8_03050 [soil metagenome]
MEGVRSAELTLDGFLSDTYSAVHPAGAALPVFARLRLARHGRDWVVPEIAMAHPMPDCTTGEPRRCTATSGRRSTASTACTPATADAPSQMSDAGGGCQVGGMTNAQRGPVALISR